MAMAALQLLTMILVTLASAWPSCICWRSSGLALASQPAAAVAVANIGFDDSLPYRTELASTLGVLFW